MLNLFTKICQLMKIFFTTLFLLSCIFLFGQTPGSLDPSFASVGFASYGPVSASNFDNAQDVVTLPNGQILFCGTSGISGNLEICVVRLNADGTIDNSYGTNGYFLYSNPNGSDFAYDMELLPNGQLLVAGALSISAANPQFALLCLHSNGTLNTSFGSNGLFVNDIDTGEDYARKIILNTTHITLAGSSKVPGFSTNRFAATRCDLNGILDPSFGIAGKITLSNSNSNTAYSACLVANNDIVICGDAYIGSAYYPVMGKINNNGQPVVSFGTNGIWTGLSQNSRYFDIDYISNQLVVSGNDGSSFTDFIIQARNESTAALVSSFGTNGSTVVNLNNADTYYELIAHPDGSLLACGTTGAVGIGAPRDFVISKFNSNGVLQTSWGTNGHTITSIFTNWDDAYGMDLYPNNRVIIAGFSAQTNTQFAVARYVYSNSAPPPIPGCMNPLACNYNPQATVDNGTCILPGTPCNDNNPNTMNDSIDANCNCVGTLIVPGCTNPAACNYNPLATVDDGTCLFPGALCDDGNPNTINDSINPDCICVGNIIVYGCTDPLSCTYDSLANVDNNTCIFPDSPCDDNNPDTFNDILDSLCNCVGTLYVSGCMDPNACNYNPLANIDDSSCLFPGSPCDDGNTLTINDSLDVNCNCVGIDVTGLNEGQFEFELHPNPAMDLLILETSLAEPKIIYILDLQGKVLREITALGHTQTIDCSALASGTYLVKVRVKDSEKMKKLLIQH